MTKVAAIQMCSSESVSENLAAANLLMQEAANNGAKLVVLPEMFPFIGDPLGKTAIKETFGQGIIQDFLALAAKRHQLWIVAGTIPIASEKDPSKIRASCLVFNPTGQCVARYDKVHLFDVSLSETESYKESETIEAGNQAVVVATPFGKLGLAICYDIRFPMLFRQLLHQGAEIIALPAAFTLPTGEAHWELLARSRAVENFCYVIGACQGGVHQNGRKTYGHSLIVEPWGTVIAENKSGLPGVIYADIDLTKVTKARKSIPIQQHQHSFD